ncbi:5'-3' exoribonuclease 3-like [Mercurialis annua]|uniref:5'-3' exoribonuclease 3-like n=1 Tax=Mercurialis annua TaxID=3986 RepID=UPI0024AEB37C|nr:5'-3' exoribonuclease 3-like [Mercurialis annua]
MGIPSFYRWLTEKYPSIAVDAVEEKLEMVDGVKVPIDTSQPNPNGMEFDNLYLDMNGIIHPCFHPEGVPPPETYDEVFQNMFKYIDRIFSVVRPRKLLFLGIDGVAPRAKMNQQRSRRFRAAKDAEIADKQMMELGAESITLEEPSKLDSNVTTSKLDSHVITPGTEFMDLLSSALQYYVRLRMNNDSGWQGIKVILSDSGVPGEGEHKIMSYIRLQRDLPGYDPNTRHCLYGLDADLIMLALATHEVHFSILREEILNGGVVLERKFHQGKKSSISIKKVEKVKFMNQEQKETNSNKNGAENLEQYVSWINFKFVNIWVLREYLEEDMRIPKSTMQTDLERLIDDFVLMCLFIGNDFLPHIPTLAISEGAIDMLMMVYTKEFLKMGGYLTDSFEVNLTRLEHFIQAVGSHEDAILRKHTQIQRQRKVFKRKQFSKRKVEQAKQNDPNALSTNAGSSLMIANVVGTKVEEINHSSDDTDSDVDKLGEGDWKGRYYVKKFKATTKEDCEGIRRHVVFKYMEGICWVMRYYYEGVCSWQWFYPYHYAPFASDFYGLSQLEIQFTLGEPFKPLDQLMGVLPAASAHALPVFYRKLMTDASSPILDFYPADFKLDMNGKRKKWQAICLLPFIEESRLLSEIAKVEHTLTDDERRRNSLGTSFLFLHVLHPLGDAIIHLSEQNCDPNILQKIDPQLSGGMNGFVCISDKAVYPEEVYSPIDGMQMIAQNRVICVLYRYPLFHCHISKLPEGVILPVKSSGKQEILPCKIWHETVVSKGVYSRRPIPKSVSGLQLAILAHRLVSSCIPKQEDSHGYKGPNLLADNIGDVCEGRKTGKGKHFLDISKQCISQDQGGDKHIPDAVKETKTESRTAKLKRRKERKRLKKSRQTAEINVIDKNGVQLRHCIQKSDASEELTGNDAGFTKSIIAVPSNYVEKLDSSAHVNQTADNVEGCSFSCAENGSLEKLENNVSNSMEMKTQVKSKKRKQRSDKNNLIKDDDCHVSIEQTVGINGFLETASSSLSNVIEKVNDSHASGSRESAGAVSSNIVEKFNESLSAISSNTVEKLGSGHAEQIIGNLEKSSNLGSTENGNLEKLEHDACNMLEIKRQVKSEKRKARSDKNKQIKLDDNHASTEHNGGAGESLSAFPSSNVQKQESSSQMEQIDGNVEKRRVSGAENVSLEKSENDSCKKQGESVVILIGTNELETQAPSKPKWKKRKKPSVEDSVEKSESGGLNKLAGQDSKSVAANIIAVQSEGKSEHDSCKKQGESGVFLIGTELETQSPSKPKWKKRKKPTVGEIVEKLESGGLNKLAGQDSNNVAANVLAVQSEGKSENDSCKKQGESVVVLGTNELETQAPSKPKWKKRKKPSVVDSVEKSESGDLNKLAGQDSNNLAANVLALQSEGKSENDSCKKQGDSVVALIGTNELETQAPTKPKWKKRKKPSVVDSVEKSESGGLNKLAGQDSNGVAANVIAVQSEGKSENGSCKKQGESGVFLIGTNELETQAPSKPKWKKRKKPTVVDSVEKLESGSLNKLAGQDSNSGAANVLAVQSEGKSENDSCKKHGE